MSIIGNSERETQNRIIALFTSELGYRYLGEWSDREGNSNIEEGLLTAYLLRSGYTGVQIAKAIHELRIEKAIHELRIEASNPNRTLYENNRKVYSLLHYGVPVKLRWGRTLRPSSSSTWSILNGTILPLQRR